MIFHGHLEYFHIHLVYFVVILCTFFRFGMLHQENLATLLEVLPFKPTRGTSDALQKGTFPAMRTN
jgi:hypothetical protein